MRIRSVLIAPTPREPPRASFADGRAPGNTFSLWSFDVQCRIFWPKSAVQVWLWSSLPWVWFCILPMAEVNQGPVCGFCAFSALRTIWGLSFLLSHAYTYGNIDIPMPLQQASQNVSIHMRSSLAQSWGQQQTPWWKSIFHGSQNGKAQQMCCWRPYHALHFKSQVQKLNSLNSELQCFTNWQNLTI